MYKVAFQAARLADLEAFVTALRALSCLLLAPAFIPTLAALFRFIYFWFKCCKMKV